MTTTTTTALPKIPIPYLFGQEAVREHSGPFVREKIIYSVYWTAAHLNYSSCRCIIAVFRPVYGLHAENEEIRTLILHTGNIVR